MVDEPNWAEAERVREQIRGAPQLSTDSLPDRDAQVREFERIHAALEDAIDTWFHGVEQLYPNWDDLCRAPSNPYAVYHELHVALEDWYDHNIPHWYRDEEEPPQPGNWLAWLDLTAQERHNAVTELTRAPDAGRLAPRREPIRPERAADAQAEEDARLAADLAKAREAAQRLAQKRDATLDADARAHAEIEAALEAERARRAAEALAAAQRDHEQGMHMSGP